jgi:hypothetical protein
MKMNMEVMTKMMKNVLKNIDKFAVKIIQLMLKNII